MRLAVIGTGYVGLVTGAGLAELNHTVTCMDIDEQKIQTLQQGKVPIHEPGLPELVAKHHNKRLFFTTSLAEAVKEAQAVFLALPTPPDPTGRANTRAIFQVAEQLTNYLSPGTLVITKSTVPVGTTERIAALFQEKNANLEVVANPEFLREGKAVHDFLHPDRIVIGIQSETARNQMQQIYAAFAQQGVPILFMDWRSAELTKYAANAYLATRISFINEIARIAEAWSADIEAIRQGIGLDPRIGTHYLHPSLGYGGSCLPKDVKALIWSAREVNIEPHLLQAVDTVNHTQRQHFLEKILHWWHNHPTIPRVLAIWGAAFKANTDDIREAPILELIPRLLEEGFTLRVHDPVALPNLKKVFGNQHANLYYIQDMYEALNNACALLIHTEWQIYREASLTEIRKRLRYPVIFDGRNLFPLDQIQKHQFTYFGVGRQWLPT